MKVVIQLRETSQPLEYESINTYQKGDMYCVYSNDGLVYKFPMSSIFRVVEDYGYHGVNIKETRENFIKDK